MSLYSMAYDAACDIYTPPEDVEGKISSHVIEVIKKKKRSKWSFQACNKAEWVAKGQIWCHISFSLWMLEAAKVNIKEIRQTGSAPCAKIS